jgi:16S rRNA (cytosine967-C5)-methyltransferase
MRKPDRRPTDVNKRAGPGPAGKSGGSKGTGQRSTGRRDWSPPSPPGLAARVAAVRIIDHVMTDRATLDEAMDAAFDGPDLDPRDHLESRDRAFARAIASTVLRRSGELEAVLCACLTKPPKSQGQAWPILMAGAAQLLMLDTPPHAAIGLAVDQVRADHRARHLTGLVNAVLRRVALEGRDVLASLDVVAANTPPRLLDRWTLTYGAEMARAIAAASLQEAPLDVSVKSDASGWAERLDGIVLPTGSVRLIGKGAIEDLPGFGEGAWWVQDAAASLPARLVGDVAGREVADLCAAPGGKTAELAVAGAKVTAVDGSEARVRRLRTNLDRLGLTNAVAIEVADVTTWAPGRQFDAVLLDAPCTATGTIRRHPDILHLRSEVDVARLVPIQSALLNAAADLVRPGGVLVYCTCSLEPEEGRDQIAQFLAGEPAFVREPVRSEEVGGLSHLISADGDLRTLPCHGFGTDTATGMDGFFAARLRRSP